MTNSNHNQAFSVFGMTRNSVELITKQLMAITSLSIDMLEARGPMLMELASACVEAAYIDCNLRFPSRSPVSEYDGATESRLWVELKGYLMDVAGFELLGSGHFSIALSHSLIPSRVIKVGLKKEDSGAAYAAFCRLNAGMEGLPTIYSLQRHSRCYTVLMDAYDDMEECEDDGDNIDYCYALTRRVLTNDAKGRARWVKFYQSEHEEGAVCLELLKTTEAIYNFFKGIATFDLHEGNVMVHRKTGKLIITDPVSYTKVSDVETLSDAVFSSPEDFIALIDHEKEVKHRARFKARHERKHIARFNPERFKARKAARKKLRKL